MAAGIVFILRRVKALYALKLKKYFVIINNCSIFANEFNEEIRKMFDGVVAQLVEQRTENPCVTGSIPVNATRREVQ